MKLRRRSVALPPPRAWFQDKDGTFFRNCPLIMAEQRAVMYKPWLAWHANQLRDEWHRAFSLGLLRKDTLGPGDVVVQPAPFREVYPHMPGLWVLDEERYQ